MHQEKQSIRTHRQSGQTLIIALLVLGIMLILGFVFAGLVSRNITQTGRSKQRTVATDLAEAGVRYAHSQLLTSALGADWRPVRTGLTPVGGFVRDPDALYLRDGTNYAIRPGLIDKGGPDGLGPYTRIDFDRGRSLVRVRYAPADWSLFDTPSGALRQPGKARNYIVIESIGRAGRVNSSDPTIASTPAIQVTGFANAAEFLAALGKARGLDASLNATSRKQLAFATIGITETARFITNKFKTSNAADLGSLTAAVPGDEGLGINYDGRPVRIVSQFGGLATSSAGYSIGSGSLYSNADVTIHGRSQVFVNSDLGDMWAVAGTIRPQNNASELDFTVIKNGAVVSGGGFDPIRSGNELDSRTGTFETLRGVIRDGSRDTDPNGYARSIPRKEPPSILQVDPATNIQRYITLSRDSGRIVFGRNTGRLGYGEGIYVVASANERGDAQDEDERIRSGSARSVMQDWLNPNKAATSKTGGWVGPYYVPLAAYLRLNANGFEITRDSRSGQPTWRRPDGSDTGSYTARFRLVGLGAGTYVINSVVSPDLMEVNDAQLTGALQNRVLVEGFPFNGVLYFEGDVRVRGVIPTDRQVTVVSMGSIYIDGSITKGVTSPSNGSVIGNPSKSMCALLAKDYVCVNTTQFFGPGPDQTLTSKNATPGVLTQNAVEVTPDGITSRLRLQTQFLLNPETDAFTGSQANNPSTWRSYASRYAEANSNAPIASKLLISHAADDGGPAFLNLNVLPHPFAGGAVNPLAYQFPSYLDEATRTPQTFNELVRPYYTPAGTTPVNVPLYGLGTPGRNTYPTFETISLPLADQTSVDTGGRVVSGVFTSLALQDETEFELSLDGIAGLKSSNYEVARVAVTPYDIQIDAICYAEEGSFFVIPGLPFNIDPNDTRARFENRVTAIGLAAAQQERFDDFGAMPEKPFFNEPMNVRVKINGSISENMPVPISVQAAWQRLWGWMPRTVAATGKLIPRQHVPAGFDITVTDGSVPNVPNLILTYDSALGTASASSDPNDPIRTTPDGRWVLPAAPRLPVSSQLAYFGEVTP